MAAEPWSSAALAFVLLLVAVAMLRNRSRSKAKPAAPEKPVASVPAEPAKPAKPAPPSPRAKKDDNGRYVAIYASEACRARLSECITLPCVVAKSKQELISVIRRRRPLAAFVDADLLPAVRNELANVTVVAVVDAPPAEALAKTVDSLDSASHVIAAALLASPQALPYLKKLLDRLGGGTDHDLLGMASVGRVAMLARASRRDARFERIEAYFSKHGVTGRMITAINDVAEELVMNALYNAPTEAGYFKKPVSRTEDVDLPLERACEISYGIEDDTAFVRVRDTFGALRRDRLLEVLNRCSATTGVELDESRGGAGLGMWRVFSAASTIVITVVPGRLTDILIRLSTKRRTKQLSAVHMFFVPDTQVGVDALMLDRDNDLVDCSVTILRS